MNNFCLRCKGAATEYISVHDINQKRSDRKFQYYRCAECGLIFLDPIPEDIQKYYGQAYPAYQKVENFNKEASGYDLDKLAVVKTYADGKKLLEIGPGWGAFAYLAKQEGYVVDAIEMDETCCKYLEESIGIHRVVNSTDVVGALAELEGNYDVIVMWHVLEHLKNSWDVLRSLPKKLAAGGVIIVAVPNPDSLQFKLFKKYWKHLDAPRHVVFTPMKLMSEEMMNLGLERITVTTKGKVNLIFDSFGWWLNSLGNYIAENPGKLLGKIMKKRRIAQILYFLMIGWAERIEGNGNAYLAVFRKTKD